MSKVSLTVQDEQLFGKYFPSVNIERVEIATRIPTEFETFDEDRYSWITIDASIYITCPPDLTMELARTWVDNSLGDIKLFFVWSPYGGFVENLKRGKLWLQDLFKADEAGYDGGYPWYYDNFLSDYEALRVAADSRVPEGSTEYQIIHAAGPDTWGDLFPGSSADSYALYNKYHRPYIWWKRLRLLIDEVDTTWAFIYDEKGNKTLRIGTVQRKKSQSNWRLRNSRAFTVMAFCGAYDDVTGLEGSEATAGKALQEESPDAFQRRFGDISYEVALINNVVPMAAQSHFVYAATDALFPAVPIQALNGTYRDSLTVGHIELENKLAALLASFEPLLSKSVALKTNYDAIASILSTNSGKTDILRQLNRYRKTFTSKDGSTISGKFYLGFQAFISSFNNLLLNQEEVKLVQYLNTRIVDLRGDDLGTTYLTPAPITYPADGDDYIPKKWITYSRTTADTRPTHGALGDFAEFILEEGFGSIFSTPTPFRDDGAGFTMFGTGTTGESAPVYDDYAEIIASAIGLDYAVAKRVYHEDWDELNAYQSSNYGGPVTGNRDADIVVKNQGFIHFDWEKALWTKSKIGWVLDLRRLKTYFGLEVPYSYYPVVVTKLHRSEALLVTQLAEMEPEGSGTMGPVIHPDYSMMNSHLFHITDGENSLAERLDLAGIESVGTIDVTLTNVMQRDLSEVSGIRSTVPYAAPLTHYNRHTTDPPPGMLAQELNFADADFHPGMVQPQIWKKYGYPWVGKMSLEANLSTDSRVPSPGGKLVRYVSDALIMAFSSLGGGSAVMNLAADWAHGYDAYITSGMTISFDEIFGARPAGGDGAVDGPPLPDDIAEVMDATLATIKPDYTLSSWTGAINVFDELHLDVFTGNLNDLTADEVSDHIEFSFLKFKNFDVMNPDPANTAVGFALTDKFQDGYRLMSFEFQDWMDDDVAYRNTIGWEYSQPEGDFNWRDSGATSYTKEIYVKDKTLLFYDYFYKLVKAEYDKFMKYYSYCLDKCSYNQDNFVFEDWFKDEVLARWPTPETQPWLRAPVIFNALRMVLFSESAFSSGTREEAKEAMDLNTLQWVSKISPYSGRITYLQHFRFWFANTLNMLYPQADLPQTVEALFDPEFDEMREIIESVDLTRPEDERRVVYTEDGSPYMYGEGSSRGFGFNAVYQRLLNVAMLWDPYTVGETLGVDSSDYDITGGGESSFLGSTTTTEGGSDDHGGLYMGAITRSNIIRYSNTWPIDRQIFGETRLSALDRDDYQPIPSMDMGGTSLTGEALLETESLVDSAGGSDVSESSAIIIQMDTQGDSDTLMSSGPAVGTEGLDWSMMRYRILSQPSGWTRDNDFVLGGSSSMYGYFSNPGTELGIIQGFGKHGGRLVFSDWFLAGEVGVRTFSVAWQEMKHHTGGYFAYGENVEKAYAILDCHLLFEIYHAGAARWVGLEAWKFPIPIGVTRNGWHNWWAYKRSQQEVEMSGYTKEGYYTSIRDPDADGSHTFVYAGHYRGGYTAYHAARAFTETAWGDDWRSSGFEDPSELLSDWRGPGPVSAMRSFKTHFGLGSDDADIVASGYVLKDDFDLDEHDWALEALLIGGNRISFNHMALGNAALLRSSFRSSLYNMEQYRLWQLNELQFAMRNGTAPLPWKWCFDWEEPIEVT